MEKSNSKYNSLSEWKKADPNGYNQAFKKNMLDEICLKFGWEKTIRESNWIINYNLLKEYTQKNIVIEATLVYKSIKLGHWVVSQRQKYKRGKLSEQKAKLLSEISGWFWEQDKIREDNWNSNYTLLKEYIELYNELPTVKIFFKNSPLGQWVRRQRTGYNEGTLSKVKIDLLEQIGLWNWSFFENEWSFFYNTLVEYIKIYGKIPNSTTEFKQIKLGSWCTSQKTSYKENKLDIKKIDLLSQIEGWIWNLQDEVWKNNFELLKKYISLYKCIPPGKLEFEGAKLGLWCDRQRQVYKKGILSKERVIALEKLGEWYWFGR